jgi:hypothetical protein
MRGHYLIFLGSLVLPVLPVEWNRPDRESVGNSGHCYGRGILRPEILQNQSSPVQAPNLRLVLHGPHTLLRFSNYDFSLSPLFLRLHKSCVRVGRRYSRRHCRLTVFVTLL